MPNINVDAPVEFGRPLNLNNSVFDNNFTRLVSMPNGHQRVVADFEQFECKNIQVEEVEEQDLNEWVEVRKESPEAKANRLKEERSFLQTFASGEFLAHHLPYQDLESKKMIRVLEADGSHREYTIKKLQATHDGLVGYILVPTTAATDRTVDLKVIFQGTASLGGVDRDVFECGGAGAESFQKNRDGILSQINAVVAQYQKPTNITVAGHSLGSSDAQNCMGSLMEGFAQSHGVKATADDVIPKSCRTDLGKIQQLTLFGCNSSGIPQATNERAKKLAKIFHEKKLPIALGCHYLRIHRDGVQQTGETTLLNDLPAEHGTVEVMKATSLEKYSYAQWAARIAMVGTAAAIGVATAPILPVGIAAGAVLALGTTAAINTADAHTQHVFNPNAPQHFSYERYSNQDPSEKYKVDVKKSSVLNTAHKGLLSVVNKLKGIRSSVADAFRPSPKPVLFSAVAQSVGSASLPVIEKPAIVESLKNQKSFWQRFRGGAVK